MAPIKNLAWALFLAADFAAAHSAITNAVGNAGGSGMGLGVDTSTPRDGTNRRPFQTDSTRFRGSSAATVGETLAGGDNNIEQGTTDIMEETGDVLPQVTPGGSLDMTIHQVNSDGAGPYTCMINADGTGTSWENIPVTTNVEGNQRGRNRDGEMGDFPLVASIPQSQTCTGSVAGEDNVCLVRCQNPARAGPFGGVVPVQMAQPQNTAPANGAPANNAPVNNAPVNNAPVNNAPVNNGGNAAIPDGTAGNAPVQSPQPQVPQVPDNTQTQPQLPGENDNAATPVPTGTTGAINNGNNAQTPETANENIRRVASPRALKGRPMRF